VFKTGRCWRLECEMYFTTPYAMPVFYSPQHLWERKFELDSLAAVLMLSARYYEATGDLGPFTPTWVAAVELIVDTIREETKGTCLYPSHTYCTSYALPYGRGKGYRPLPTVLYFLSRHPSRHSSLSLTHPAPQSHKSLKPKP
jgi:glycosyl hydrolase family 125 (putative metal-dependent alpha-mannosidase)